MTEIVKDECRPFRLDFSSDLYCSYSYPKIVTSVSIKSGRNWRILYLPTFSDPKACDFFPGSARIFDDDTTVSEDFRELPNTSEEIRRRSKVLKKKIMLHTDLPNS